MKTIFIKILEYTPILSIIPGSIRISTALETSNTKVRQIAQNSFHISSWDRNYSPKKEIARGIVSCIPFVNLILIPIDIVSFSIHKVSVAKSKDSPPVFDNNNARKGFWDLERYVSYRKMSKQPLLTREKNLEKAHKALLTLATCYEEVEQYKLENSISHTGCLEIKYSHKDTKIELEKRLETLDAFMSLYESLLQIYGEHEVNQPDLSEISAASFDIPLLIHLLGQWYKEAPRYTNGKGNLSRAVRHSLWMIDPPLDCNHRKLAIYLRLHHQTLLNLIQGTREDSSL